MAMKNSTIIGIIAGALITIAIGLGSWNLAKTASVPEQYATKAALKEVKDDAARERESLKQDVKDRLDDLATEQRYIKNAVDEINRHLRDLNGHN